MRGTGSRQRISLVFVAVLGGLAGACGFTSTPVPPIDGIAPDGDAAAQPDGAPDLSAPGDAPLGELGDLGGPGPDGFGDAAPDDGATDVAGPGDGFDALAPRPDSRDAAAPDGLGDAAVVPDMSGSDGGAADAAPDAGGLFDTPPGPDLGNGDTTPFDALGPDGSPVDGRDDVPQPPDLPVPDLHGPDTPVVDLPTLPDLGPADGGLGDTPGVPDVAPADVPGPDETSPPVPPPQKQAFFTFPQVDGGNDATLEDLVVDVLGQASPGSVVRAAYYGFSRARVANAFVAAHDRGVDVRVIIGNNNVHPGCEDYVALATLKAGLGAGNVIVCQECADSGGCLGTGINHNKFIVFSALDDGSRNVVLQSSANATNPQLRQYNNTVIIRNDAALHTAYRTYWDDLSADRRNLDYYWSAVGDTGTKAYFFPRASGDTVVSVIENADCAVAGTRIRVAMAFFTDGRLEVAEALAAAKRAGCAVSVLLRDEPPDYPGDDVVDVLEAANVTVRLFPIVNDVSIHSKYLLIEGGYYGATGAKLVWTGSHNYTGPALRGNDETLLKIDDPVIYDAFLADWVRIRDAIDALP